MRPVSPCDNHERLCASYCIACLMKVEDQRDTALERLSEVEKERDSALDRIAELEKVLRFYADRHTYSEWDPKHYGKRFSRPIEYDVDEKSQGGALWWAGARARRVLGITKTSDAGGGTDLREGAALTGIQVDATASDKTVGTCEGSTQLQLTAKVTDSERDTPNTLADRGSEESATPPTPADREAARRYLLHVTQSPVFSTCEQEAASLLLTQLFAVSDDS